MLQIRKVTLVLVVVLVRSFFHGGFRQVERLDRARYWPCKLSRYRNCRSLFGSGGSSSAGALCWWFYVQLIGLPDKLVVTDFMRV